MTSYDDMVNLRGGRLLKKVSVSDPCGNFYAQCSKHPEYWGRIDYSDDRFTMSASEIRNAFISDAQRIIDLCPSCAAERKAEITVVGPACAQEEHDACGCPQ